MKLSVTNPEILAPISDFPGGLWPARRGHRMTLIVKAPKEIAVAAKLRRSFRLYLVPLRADDVTTYGLLTAFVDDDDEPLTIRTLLFDEDITSDFLSLLSSPVFYLHFFDDHDRELAAYRADNPNAVRFQLLSTTFRFLPFSLDLARQFQDDMQFWFGDRSSEHDDAAFTIHLRESLFRDLLAEHIDNPGALNEPDIAAALHRAFSVDQVFTSPIRADNGRELADVVVATPRTLLLIQAKDSPSTESSISRNISRKRATTIKHVKKAARQLTGSINHLLARDESIDVVVDGRRRVISTSGRQLLGLTIVKELFEPDRPSCSLPILDVFQTSGVPCVLLDYLEFRRLTYSQPSEVGLMAMLADIFSVANQLDEFPPCRFGFRTDRTVVYQPRRSAAAPASPTDQKLPSLAPVRLGPPNAPGPYSPMLLPDPAGLHQVPTSPAIHVVVDRADVEALDVAPTARVLSLALANREAVQRHQGRLEIAFAGYAHDQRELYEIPEVRRFCTELDESFPYWFYFLSTDTATLGAIASCLCSATKHGPGFVRFGPDLVEFLTHHFEALNWLFDNYSLDESDNEKISRTVIEYFSHFESDPDHDTPA